MGSGDPGDGDIIGYRLEKQTIVVKRCLKRALSSRLTLDQRTWFLNYLDTCTELASKLSRRASIAFLFYIVRHQELGHILPDFENVGDAYWKSWLRIGLLEFGNEYPYIDPANVKAAQSDASRAATSLIFSEIDGLLGNTVDSAPEAADVPVHFDRILGHAAIQFKTAVLNCQTVHFFDKLQRLCRLKVAEHDHPGGATAHSLLLAVCNNASKEGWPNDLAEFVKTARQKLGLGGRPNVKVDASTVFSFPVRFDFHWWEQQEFASMGQKKMMLSPVFNVHRAHVRLDATHLCWLLDIMFSGKEAISLLKSTTISIPETPALSKKAAKELFIGDKAAANAEWKRVHDLRLKRKTQEAAFKADRANLKKQSSYSLTKAKPVDVAKAVQLEHPLPSMKRPASMTDDAAWKIQRAALHLDRDAANKRRNECMSTQAYKDAVIEYDNYENKKNAYAMSIFANFNDRNPKQGWKPSASVVTDTVALSVTYERIIRVAVITGSAEEARFKAEKAEKAEKRKLIQELPPFDDYDPDDNTCYGDALVLGIDPGRTTLVTIVCIDYMNRKHKWSLSRGRYHTESGILYENKLKAVRFSGLKDDFASLITDGGALRASTSAEIVAYVERYKTFEAKWWNEFALKRKESRANFQRFVGKQKTLSTFFGKVRKEADKLLGPDQTRIEVAYGAAGKTMAPSGRGELGVPTKGTFAFCARAFLGEHPGDSTSGNVVTFEDETNTSKKCWLTKGTLYEKVYKTYDANGKEFLQHTRARQPPFVPLADVEAEEMRVLERKDKSRRRRGGESVAAPVAPPDIAEDEEEDDDEGKKRIRYAVCRGLLFCPEKSMYYDRDGASAHAIAGLRVLKLKGLGRPSAFRRALPGQATAAMVNNESVAVEEMRPADEDLRRDFVHLDRSNMNL